MTMFYIILLIVLGLLFLVAELVLLPGVSIGAILALVCYGAAAAALLLGRSVRKRPQTN